MFQKNLAAIKSSNPVLAEKLEKIDIKSIKGIEVFNAESNDLIISYNNILLHSAIDPVREAKTTWNRTINCELNKNDIQIVFGLGLGYLFKRAYVSAVSKIFVIEPNIDVLRFVLEHVDFSNELSDKRVFITDNSQDIYQKLQNEYFSGDRLEFLFLNNFANANINLLQELTAKSFEIIGTRGSDECTISILSRYWAINFLLNIKSYPEARPLGYLEDKFTDKTALILAAGPSLADDIEKIKINRNKYITIAVGRSFKLLVESGIIPDFTVFADAINVNQQVNGVEEYLEKTNLILLSKADCQIYNLKSKSKIIYLSETDSISKIFTNNESNYPGLYKTGSSVSIICYYIAKALGFSKIAFSGLDLAYINNKLHADGTSIDEYNDEIKEFLQKRYVRVKDKDGNDLPSRNDYALFIRQFSEIFTEEVNLAEIINTSIKGAYIKGMNYMPFDEFVESLNETKPNTDEIISEVMTQTKESWAISINHLHETIKVIYQKICDLQPVINEISIEFKQIYDELTETGITNYNPEKYDILKNKAINTRETIMSDELISYLIQGHLWNYTKNYCVNDKLDKTDITNNIKTESELFYKLNEDFTYFIKIINYSLPIFEEKIGLIKK